MPYYRLRSISGVFLVLLACLASTFAAPLYWNVGGTTPTGTWDLTTANWNASPLGLPSGNVIYTSPSDAYFSAGTAGTGTFTVTLATTLKATSLNFEEGKVTIAPVDVTNHFLTLSGATPTIHVQNMDSTISSRINTDTTNPTVTKTGQGKLVLNHGTTSIGGFYNLGTGSTLRINAGAVEIVGTQSADQLTIGRIVVNGTASFIHSAVNSISNNVVFQIENGGLVMNNNTSDLVGNLSGNGMLFMRGGTSNFAPSTTTEVFTGIITGTGSIGTSNGNGAVILAGANTFTGTTSLSTGVTGNDATGNPIGSTNTSHFRLAHQKALQLSTVLQRNTSGPGLTFDSATTDTFTLGGLTSISIGTGITQAIHNALKPIVLQDLSNNAIKLQVGYNDSSTNYSGQISGSGSLVKVGAGTLTVTGHYNTDNSTFTPLNYTGQTVINRTAHHSASSGSSIGPTTVGTLNLNFGTTYAPNNNIINPASALVLGGGRLLVTGKNNFAANQAFASTQLNAAHSYIEAAPGATASTVNVSLGAITRQSGAVLDFILPAGSTVSTSAAATNSNGILGPWAFIGTNWVMKDGSNNLVAYDKVANYATQLGGAISSDASINLELTTGNPAVAMTVAGNGTTHLNTLQVTDSNTIQQTITIGSNGVLSTQAIWRNSTNNAQLTITGGSVTAGANTGANTDLIIRAADNRDSAIRIESAITNNAGGGAVTLVKVGQGQLHLINASTYTGGTYIHQGRVQVAHANALGTGTVTVAAGGQAFLTASNVNNDFVIAGMGWNEGAGPGAIRSNSGTIGSAGKSITLAGDARIGTNGGTVTIASKITGDYAFDLSAAGTQGIFILTNTANDFAGNFTVNTVIGSNAAFGNSITTVRLGAAQVIPDGVGKGNVILSGGSGAVTLDLNGFNETINALNSQGTASSISILNNGATLATLTLGNNDAHSIYTPNTTLAQISTGFGGALKDGTAVLALTKIGLGTQTLSGANTYSGNTQINAGTLEAGAANTFSANSAVSIAASPTAILDLADFNQVIASLSGGGFVNLGTNTGGTLTTGNATDTVYAGEIVGAGGLVKQGAGQFTVTGANSYVGTTTVNTGVFQVGVAGVGQSGSGAVAINSTATLAGSGTVRGATTLNAGSFLRPGDSAGTGRARLVFSDISANSLNLGASSTTVLTLAGATGLDATPLDGIQTAGLLNGAIGNHDQIVVHGGLTLNAGGTIQVTLDSSYSPSFGEVYNLFDWGTVSGASLLPNGFDVNTDLILQVSTQMTANGWTWARDQFISDGIIYVIPEPSRCLLLIAGMLAVGLRRRRGAL